MSIWNKATYGALRVQKRPPQQMAIPPRLRAAYNMSLSPAAMKAKTSVAAMSAI
jgi:hypothetical protein